MICRVLALHLLTRERQLLQQQQRQQQRQPPAYTTPAATTSPQWAQQPPSQQQPQPLPDRPTLVRRLAAELVGVVLMNGRVCACGLGGLIMCM